MTDQESTEALVKALGYELSDHEIGVLADDLKSALNERLSARPGASTITAAEAVSRAGKAPYADGEESDSYSVEGEVASGFEKVREAFANNFRKGMERNAQLVVYVAGEVVVDLWGTNLEPGMTTAPDAGYDGDTLQSVYSSGKAIESTVFAMAVDRGLLSFDDPVTKYWPEFGVNGKDHLSIADVLRHDAGLHAFSRPLSAEDVRGQADADGNMSTVIAEQAPWTWSEGEFKGQIPRIYHAVSRGYVLSQILLRADPAHRTIGRWMVEELCGPLSAAFFCGDNDVSFSAGEYPEAEMHFRTGPDRLYQFANGTIPATIQRLFPERFQPSAMEQAVRALRQDPLFEFSPDQNPQGRLVGGRPNPMGFDVDPGDDASRLLEITSSSSRASARGMARVMGMLANGGSLGGQRLLTEAGCAVATDKPVSAKVRPNGRFGMAESVFVQAGWGVTGADTFGWGGAGGSVIQFSPARKLGMGYTCTGFGAGLSGDQDRVGPIARALYEATGQ